MTTEVLGIVGIRSGSKGVPDKNVRQLRGHPLVAWILTEARTSRQINRLVVSTDSPRYAEIAQHYGAEVPGLRPPELARDDTPDSAIVRHILDLLDKQQGYRPDIVLRLLATVPLQRAEDADTAVDLLVEHPELSSVVVVAEARQHPAKAIRLVGDGNPPRAVSYLTGRAEDIEPRARQAYEPAYFRGNIVATRRRTLMETGTLTGAEIGCHLIPQERAIDIDTAIDFTVLEQLMELHDRRIPDIEPFEPSPTAKGADDRAARDRSR